MQLRPESFQFDENAPNGMRELNPVPHVDDTMAHFTLEKRESSALEIEAGLVHLLSSLLFFRSKVTVSESPDLERVRSYLGQMQRQWHVANVLVRAVAAKGWDALAVAIYEELELVAKLQNARDYAVKRVNRVEEGPEWLVDIPELVDLAKLQNMHRKRFHRLAARLKAHYRYFVEDRSETPLSPRPPLTSAIPVSKRTLPLTKTGAAALKFRPKTKTQRDAARNKLKRMIEAGEIVSELVPRDTLKLGSNGKEPRPRYYFHIDQLKFESDSQEE